MNIVRDSFRAGLIGKQYRFQSSTEGYGNALIQADNVLIDPYGQVTRRPPLVSIGTISSITDNDIPYFPKDARVLDFVFSSEFRYLVGLVTYSADGEEDIARIVVTNTEGVQKAILPIRYTQLEIQEMDTHQSNDIMWIAHQNHRPAELVRVSDDNWNLNAQDIVGGPFVDENEDQDITIRTNLSQWYGDINYLEGDRVLPESSGTLSANWIGTVFSHKKESTLSSELSDAERGDAYYRNRSVYHNLSFTFEWDHYIIDKEWFFLLIRIDEAVQPTVSIGDFISINCDFIEDEYDTAYSVTGSVNDIIDKGAYHYIKIESNLYSDIRYRGGSGNLGIISSSYTSVPDVELPSGSDSEYNGDVFRIYSHPQESAQATYNDYSGINRRRHLFLFGSATHGGSFVQVTGNVVVGDNPDFYEANQDTLNSAPPLDPPWTDILTQPDSSAIQELNTLGFSPFTESDVGLLLTAVNALSYTDNGTFSVLDEASDTVSTTGIVTLTTDGAWTGEIIIESKPIDRDDTYYEELTGITSTGSFNGSTSVNIDQAGVEVRVRMAEYTTGDCKWVLDAPNGDRPIYRVEKVITSNAAIVRVLSGTTRFITSYRWSLGAFGGENGYPGTVTIDDEDRLWYGGSIGEPFRLWGSQVGKYSNFTIGVLATSALVFQARANSSTRISWMEPKDGLFFGTDFGEYAAINRDDSQILSAANVPKIDRYSTDGGARIPAVQVGNALAYVSADRKKAKFLQYDGVERYSHRSYDMTHKVPDIAGSGFRGSCLQRTPYPILWFWTDDGKAISFTVNQENGVVAWAEHSTQDGLIKSLCVIPDENGIDEVYAVVEREDNVLSATGTMTPDVTGIINKAVINGENSVAVCGSGDSFSNKVLYYARTNEDGRKDYQIFDGSAVKIEFTTNIDPIYGDEKWIIMTGSLGFSAKYSNNSDSIDVPEAGWNQEYGSLPLPSVYKDVIYEFDSRNFAIALVDGKHVIIDINTGHQIFENNGLYGEYTPVSGSGATGSVDIQTLNYHLEKLDYQEADYTDNLGGAVETPILSEWEPTPLSRGPGFLDGNKKFRSAKAFLYVTESNGGEISIDDGNTWQDIDYSKLTADANGLYTGFVEVRTQSGWRDYTGIKVRSLGTDPFNVSAIKMPIEIGERK